MLYILDSQHSQLIFRSLGASESGESQYARKACGSQCQGGLLLGVEDTVNVKQ